MSVMKFWQSPLPVKLDAIALSNGLGSGLDAAVVVDRVVVVLVEEEAPSVAVAVPVVTLMDIVVAEESSPVAVAVGYDRASNTSAASVFSVSSFASLLRSRKRWWSSRDIMTQLSSMRTGTRVSTISVSKGCGGATTEKASVVETMRDPQQRIANEVKIIALNILGPART